MALLALFAALVFVTPDARGWPGPPQTSPPPPPQAGAPPPAYIETQTKSAWLFYGSYCWRTACVDLIPPETRPGLPVLAVARGRTVRVHLRFAATSARASVDRRRVAATFSAARRTISWTVTRGGVLTVSARAAAGDASYVARLKVR